jgi:hypothetical protein
MHNAYATHFLDPLIPSLITKLKYSIMSLKVNIGTITVLFAADLADDEKEETKSIDDCDRLEYEVISKDEFEIVEVSILVKITFVVTVVESSSIADFDGAIILS